MAVRRVTRAVPRKRIWARESQTATIVSGATVSIDMLADFKTAYGANQVLGATIARIRGQLVFESTGAINAAFRSAAGIIVEASTGNQSPTTQPHSDWMWYRSEGKALKFYASGNAVVTSVTERVVWPIEVKSMRKMQEINETLNFQFENGVGNPGTYWLDVSTLILLP